jgi:cob(I)alamin adenosyltransferase
MKLYTKTGDDGTTGLFGGGRVRKDHVRIVAYGTVDELNSGVGVARAMGANPRMDAILGRIQNELFVVGSDLATPAEATPWVPRVGAAEVEALERDIDAFEADVTPLKTFILPGGTPQAAALHVARTICRRAEREVVTAMEADPIQQSVAIYLNRLSDFFFVASRWANHTDGVQDVPWLP